MILTSHASVHDVNTPKVVAADAYDTIDHAIDKALHLLIGKELYHTIHIGIDPGEKPGIALVGDDILILKTQVKTPENVVKNVKRFIKEYPAHEYFIRIGHGSLLIRTSTSRQRGRSSNRYDQRRTRTTKTSPETNTRRYTKHSREKPSDDQRSIFHYSKTSKKGVRRKNKFK